MPVEMMSLGAKGQNKRFQLNDMMSKIAEASPDPVARTVCKVLQAFGSSSEVIGRKYFWKYLPDEAYSAICKKPGMSVRTMNRIFFSHLETSNNRVFSEEASRVFGCGEDCGLARGEVVD